MTALVKVISYMSFELSLTAQKRMAIVKLDLKGWCPGGDWKVCERFLWVGKISDWDNVGEKSITEKTASKWKETQERYMNTCLERRRK